MSEAEDVEVQIRPPTAADAKALIDFIALVAAETPYLTFGPGEFAPTEEEEVQFIETGAERGDLQLAAFARGEVVGFINAVRENRPRTRHIAAFGVSVRRAYWGRGLGERLLLRLISWAEAEGVRKINLRVRADNERAIALYRRLGFVEEGRISRAYLVDGAFFDDLCMGLPLD